MKDDRVTSVRLTLLKSLRLMPLDIRDSSEVKTILQKLEDEVHTWEGSSAIYNKGKAGNNCPQYSLYQSSFYTSPTQSHTGDQINDNVSKVSATNSATSLPSLKKNERVCNVLNSLTPYEKSSISKEGCSRNGNIAITTEKKINKQSTLKHLINIPEKHLQKGMERNTDDSFSLVSI